MQHSHKSIGNLTMALDGLSNILDKVPKQTHVAGDFNIDLHSSNRYNFKVKATNLMTKLPSDFSISSIYLKYDMFIA